MVRWLTGGHVSDETRACAATPARIHPPTHPPPAHPRAALLLCLRQLSVHRRPAGPLHPLLGRALLVGYAPASPVGGCGHSSFELEHQQPWRRALLIVGACQGALSRFRVSARCRAHVRSLLSGTHRTGRAGGAGRAAGMAACRMHLTMHLARPHLRHPPTIRALAPPLPPCRRGVQPAPGQLRHQPTDILRCRTVRATPGHG